VNQNTLQALPNILEASNLSVVLGRKKVLEIPSLQVLPNEVFVVIGPNGSGKTTLLLCMALLLKPASGTISYRGHVINHGSDLLSLRRRFAVVFQESLLLNTTVWNNISLGLRLRKFKRDEIKPRVQMWLESFGIASLAQRQASTLSGGEAKRVSLARAFALQPEILFLDEPFAALDTPTHQSLIEDFDSVLRETKVTTILVTHDRSEALALANRVMLLINGKIRQAGTSQEVFSCPVDEEVANFIGAGNVIDGVVRSQSNKLALVDVGQQQLCVVSDLTEGTRVTTFLRYEDITILLQTPQPIHSSARNQLAGKIVKIFPFNSQLKVTLDCGFQLIAIITQRSWEELGLSIGQEIIASFKASSVHLMGKC
jgi:tungstate transport system ATP-binding protein